MPKPKRKIEAATAPPERWQHGSFHTVKTEVAGVERQQVEIADALVMYLRRGQLAKPGEIDLAVRRYSAGCKLHDAWTAAGLEPRVIGQYTDMVAQGSTPAVVHRIGAYKAWQAAIKAVGPIASNEVVDVCCLDKTLNSRERLEILRRGLDVLADHYGLTY